MMIPSSFADLFTEFSSLSDPKEKFAFLLELSEELPLFPEEEKTEKNKISGCASNAWISTREQDGKLFFSGDADGQISKGVIAFLITGFSGLSPKEILSLPNEFFEEGSIFSSLSPSRSHGALSMIKKIQEDAKRFSL
jgi:cysteine desulfuration protein SufE